VGEAFALFKELSDKKEMVTDGDLEALVVDDILAVVPSRRFVLKDFSVSLAGKGRATASVTLPRRHGGEERRRNGKRPRERLLCGDDAHRGLQARTREFTRITAVSEQSDAVGEADIVLKTDNLVARGRGASTDVIEASIKAYVNAVNRLYQLAAAKGVTLHASNAA
jgi:2-isopropylmalate synthase